MKSNLFTRLDEMDSIIEYAIPNTDNDALEFLLESLPEFHEELIPKCEGSEKYSENIQICFCFRRSFEKSILNQTPDALISLLKHFPKLDYTYGERDNTLIHLMIVQDKSCEFINRVLEWISQSIKLTSKYSSVLDLKNSLGQTMLHSCIHAKQWDNLNVLLKHKPDLYVQDINGETSLHYAVKTEDLLYVQIIHENAPNQQTFLPIRNLNGDTALHLAIQNGNIEVTNFLLQSKSPFYPHKDDKSTILHIAVEFLDSVKRMALIETILKNEPEPSSGSDRIITRLKNHNGYTPLHLAIERKYSDVVNILLGVDIGAMYIRDDNERTPLHLAIIPSFSDGQKCTEVSTIHQPILDSVLNACEKLDGKHEENTPCSAKHLICIQDKHKRTAMHDAIQHLNVYAFTELLKTGSCLDIPDEEGNILTHEAVKNPDDITYRILLVEELKRRYPDTLYDCFQ
ncbi:Ankyrin repeat protein [Oopsacas minuta]|uniref:Ankyrin repeat protein n=1 Tax=Oopsacas minuta TaxID=111878 RepID=A0AAV7KD74_9METZ|nr:Ankyrin repeat protein [Oopsacas minuta]